MDILDIQKYIHQPHTYLFDRWQCLANSFFNFTVSIRFLCFCIYAWFCFISFLRFVVLIYRPWWTTIGFTHHCRPFTDKFEQYRLWWIRHFLESVDRRRNLLEMVVKLISTNQNGKRFSRYEILFEGNGTNLIIKGEKCK